MSELKVILVGGTSHAGKSTLAQALGQVLSWDSVSTDSLARHPGRPWKTAQKLVPSHVADHYRLLSVDELLRDVLRHYQTMEPRIRDLVHQYADSPSGGLVLEGSALWPPQVASLANKSVGAVWLTASDSLLQQRIYATSQFDETTDQDRELIQKFLARTLLYNQQMAQEIRRLGLTSITVEEDTSSSELVSQALSVLPARR